MYFYRHSPSVEKDPDGIYIRPTKVSGPGKKRDYQFDTNNWLPGDYEITCIHGGVRSNPLKVTVVPKKEPGEMFPQFDAGEA